MKLRLSTSSSFSWWKVLPDSHFNNKEIFGHILWAVSIKDTYCFKVFPFPHSTWMLKPPVAVINMDMFIRFMILNGDSSTGWQLFEWREHNQRVVQALLLPPAVGIHLGMALVDRVAEQLPVGWQGLRLNAEWVWSDQKEKAKTLWTNIQREPAEETIKYTEMSLFWGLYLGTSSLQPILHPFSVYTLCSQQISAVSNCCHLLQSLTSKLLPTLIFSKVAHWLLAFLCVAVEERVAAIIPLMRRTCCGDSAARRVLKFWN